MKAEKSNTRTALVSFGVTQANLKNAHVPPAATTNPPKTPLQPAPKALIEAPATPQKKLTRNLLVFQAHPKALKEAQTIDTQTAKMHKIQWPLNVCAEQFAKYGLDTRSLQAVFLAAMNVNKEAAAAVSQTFINQYHLDCTRPELSYPPEERKERFLVYLTAIAHTMAKWDAIMEKRALPDSPWLLRQYFGDQSHPPTSPSGP
ncbi:hypothetical protein BDP27DRAFT_1424054 [Rhodocollybia butyracea]|uniref:Uncharacterized protein n=1 Tax=Rhodocollybia butyracea TaxID=206335 RepID=A0A9P5PQH1_9AGAR|nr:hypothetical protein BDP27DRAFT_1424054 [Rhodocollybia butyracea]